MKLDYLTRETTHCPSWRTWKENTSTHRALSRSRTSEPWRWWHPPWLTQRDGCMGGKIASESTEENGCSHCYGGPKPWTEFHVIHPVIKDCVPDAVVGVSGTDHASGALPAADVSVTTETTATSKASERGQIEEMNFLPCPGVGSRPRGD